MHLRSRRHGGRRTAGTLARPAGLRPAARRRRSPRPRFRMGIRYRITFPGSSPASSAASASARPSSAAVQLPPGKPGGSGGSGKTRLALQAAERSLAEYPDGVWLVELGRSPIRRSSRPSLRRWACARSPAAPAEHADGLPAPRSLLLLLDNCEHLIDACAALAHALLRACPELADPGDQPRGVGDRRRGDLARALAVAAGTRRAAMAPLGRAASVRGRAAIRRASAAVSRASR